MKDTSMTFQVTLAFPESEILGEVAIELAAALDFWFSPIADRFGSARIDCLSHQMQPWLRGWDDSEFHQEGH